MSIHAFIELNTLTVVGPLTSLSASYSALLCGNIAFKEWPTTPLSIC